MASWFRQLDELLRGKRTQPDLLASGEVRSAAASVRPAGGAAGRRLRLLHGLVRDLRPRPEAVYLQAVSSLIEAAGAVPADAGGDVPVAVRLQRPGGLPADVRGDAAAADGGDRGEPVRGGVVRADPGVLHGQHDQLRLHGDPERGAAGRERAGGDGLPAADAAAAVEPAACRRLPGGLASGSSRELPAEGASPSPRLRRSTFASRAARQAQHPSIRPRGLALPTSSSASGSSSTRWSACRWAGCSGRSSWRRTCRSSGCAARKATSSRR